MPNRPGLLVAAGRSHFRVLLSAELERAQLPKEVLYSATISRKLCASRYENASSTYDTIAFISSRKIDSILVDSGCMRTAETAKLLLEMVACGIVQKTV